MTFVHRIQVQPPVGFWDPLGLSVTGNLSVSRTKPASGELGCLGCGGCGSASGSVFFFVLLVLVVVVVVVVVVVLSQKQW